MLEYICGKESRQDLKKFLSNIIDSEQLKKLDYPNFDLIKRLFKYSIVNEFTHLNIKNNYLLAKRPESFNDVFDSTMHSNTFIKNKKGLDESKRISRKFGYESVYETFSDEYIKKFSEESDRHFMTYFRNVVFVNCLTTTNDNNLMWSHYADNNAGI